MKVAVTGCNGFVGRSVVSRALQNGYTVVGVDNTSSFEEAPKAFEGCDAIVQLAAIRHPADYKVNTHNCNVVISWSVLRAAAELGIERVAQALSANVLRAVFSVEPQFDYFPIDELHPTLLDEPYDLSKLVAEMQADTIVRRYPSMRVAGLRLHCSVPTRTRAYREDYQRSKGDLWSYVQEDSSAEAFVRAVTVENDEWKRHEKFFIAAPRIAADEDWLELRQEYFPDVPIKEGWVEIGGSGFFDCSKAKRILGWVHRDYA